MPLLNKSHIVSTHDFENIKNCNLTQNLRKYGFFIIRNFFHNNSEFEQEWNAIFASFNQIESSTTISLLNYHQKNNEFFWNSNVRRLQLKNLHFLDHSIQQANIAYNFLNYSFYLYGISLCEQLSTRQDLVIQLRQIRLVSQEYPSRVKLERLLNERVILVMIINCGSYNIRGGEGVIYDNNFIPLTYHSFLKKHEAVIFDNQRIFYSVSEIKNQDDRVGKQDFLVITFSPYDG